MTQPFASVAVFCGSRTGTDRSHAAAAATFGRLLARSGRRLVYGGGHQGLMGLLADAALAEGGAVLGVIPTFLAELEVAHRGLTELVHTPTMHARKTRMVAEADAFVVLPGGIGTLDEAIEVITWRTLGLHAKPLVICDVAGSAAPLLALLQACIDDGFAHAGMTGAYHTADGPHAALALLDRLADDPVR